MDDLPASLPKGPGQPPPAPSPPRRPPDPPFCSIPPLAGAPASTSSPSSAASMNERLARVDPVLDRASVDQLQSARLPPQIQPAQLALPQPSTEPAQVPW